MSTSCSPTQPGAAPHPARGSSPEGTRRHRSRPGETICCEGCQLLGEPSGHSRAQRAQRASLGVQRGPLLGHRHVVPAGRCQCSAWAGVGGAAGGCADSARPPARRVGLALLEHLSAVPPRRPGGPHQMNLVQALGGQVGMCKTDPSSCPPDVAHILDDVQHSSSRCIRITRCEKCHHAAAQGGQASARVKLVGACTSRAPPDVAHILCLQFPQAAEGLPTRCCPHPR